MAERGVLLLKPTVPSEEKKNQMFLFDASNLCKVNKRIRNYINKMSGQNSQIGKFKCKSKILLPTFSSFNSNLQTLILWDV